MLQPGMDNGPWSSLLAERFNDVNEAHPFREGNGRTQRLYFDQVAEAGGKTVHWSVLTKEQNVALSHASRGGDLELLRDAPCVMVADCMNPLAMQRAKQAADTIRGIRAVPPGRRPRPHRRRGGAESLRTRRPRLRAEGYGSAARRIRALMAIVGYARVSTLDQVLNSQVDELTAAGAGRVFTDLASGKLDARPGLAAALDDLRDHEGDVLMVTRIDRLGRSVQHLVRVVDGLRERGVEFLSLHKGIDTTTAGGEMFFIVFAAIGQFSGRIISERTQEGLAAARARGRRGGRPRAMTDNKLATALRLRGDGHTYDDIAATIGVSSSTVSRAATTALEQDVDA